MRRAAFHCRQIEFRLLMEASGAGYTRLPREQSRERRRLASNPQIVLHFFGGRVCAAGSPEEATRRAKPLHGRSEAKNRRSNDGAPCRWKRETIFRQALIFLLYDADTSAIGKQNDFFAKAGINWTCYPSIKCWNRSGKSCGFQSKMYGAPAPTSFGRRFFRADGRAG